MPKRHTFLPVLLALCALQHVATAQLVPCDNVLLTGEHVPASARSAGIANAGVAIPEGVVGALLNPAMLHSYNIFHQTNMTASFGYGSGEDLFDRHNLTVGAGLCLSPSLSLGAVYRRLTPEEDDNRNNQVTLVVSGRLFEQRLDRGMVNYGLNVRYEKLDWMTSGFDTLRSRRTNEINVPIDSAASVFAAGSIERRRLLLDVGFYQDNIGEGLDFGLTLHDIMGYTWTNERPSANHFDTAWVQPGNTPGDTDTVMVLDSNWYTDTESQFNKWIWSYNRRVTVGLAFHKEVLQDRARVYLPLDFEIFNVFDLDVKTRVAVRTGLEVWVKERYALRFGYARAPEEFPRNPGDLSNANIFSGGAGVRVSSFGADLYIRRSAWGLTASVAF